MSTSLLPIDINHAHACLLMQLPVMQVYLIKWTAESGQKVTFLSQILASCAYEHCRSRVGERRHPAALKVLLCCVESA